MKPIKFDEANSNLHKPEGLDNCGSLPVHADGTQGTISCWGLSWRERIRILFSGRIWLGVLSGGITQPPVWLSTETPFEDPAAAAGRTVQNASN